MLHLLVTVEVPRGEVDKYLKIYEENLLPWQQEILPKVGAKLLGVWTTVWGKQGEITILVATPSEEAIRKAEAMPWDKSRGKGSAGWSAATPIAIRKIMRPAPFSPIQ